MVLMSFSATVNGRDCFRSVFLFIQCYNICPFYSIWYLNVIGIIVLYMLGYVSTFICGEKKWKSIKYFLWFVPTPYLKFFWNYFLQIYRWVYSTWKNSFSSKFWRFCRFLCYFTNKNLLDIVEKSHLYQNK